MFWYIADINECQNNTDICDDYAVCNNTQGGYTCQCNSGFTDDGKNCTGMESASVIFNVGSTVYQ